jgi:hypothetical protein
MGMEFVLNENGNGTCFECEWEWNLFLMRMEMEFVLNEKGNGICFVCKWEWILF